MKQTTALRAGGSALVLALVGGAVPVALAPAALAEGKATLGPYGYGNLKLGMTATKAKATGRIVHKPDGDSARCTGWDLKENPYDEYRVGMYISKKHGVAMIVAPPGLKTPQGISLGSTNAQLKAAYPNLRRGPGGYPAATVPGNKKAFYLFYVSSKNKVDGMSLVLAKQDCVRY
ncbi:hypothetical protein GCM10022224_078900 [Nonomuraea antimicrobica]|uniref:Secreted protein n=1 Tax=Nonomuraea antimicrobica TaxID=561173 RepID=A0ABP7D5M9_9ACTN